MDHNMIVDGLKFMVLGMVTVYLFLMLMIFILKIEHKFVRKFFPFKISAQAPQQVPVIADENYINTDTNHKINSDDDLALIAAITAAIQHHKKQNG
ncbi:MAG: OadG family protein [Sulfurospirillaceae bacterium]|nr:OadG family protein [Sulfurospirillaceae bacterium]